jgi:hypothetical protein
LTHGPHGKSLGLQVRGGAERLIVIPDDQRHNLPFFVATFEAASAIASVVMTPSNQAGWFAMNLASYH